jgi:hypothetical protein
MSEAKAAVQPPSSRCFTHCLIEADIYMYTHVWSLLRPTQACGMFCSNAIELALGDGAGSGTGASRQASADGSPMHVNGM